MNITKVDIYLYDGSNALKAYANITIDDEFVVKGFRVLESKEGDLWVSCPSERGKDDEYYDVAFPITKAARQLLNDCVLDEYDKAVENAEKKHTRGGSRRK